MIQISNANVIGIIPPVTNISQMLDMCNKDNIDKQTKKREKLNKGKKCEFDELFQIELAKLK